ncbi:hypothetical protein Caci_2900 [Catenulispora acidiphila DSM 44928]|uniref:DUF4352 domain-containing protein n=1 Tax=Catenulispora acidiphila (strain DSM 44928 / JCM 14897 / NBRC 102108 / NRRL B-24433 / ID139908) TaxID=479433 RepID=C7Q2R7_CATAD|nr:DUF4352 domain-containing protein [Catenulispora acidiphila]ACU71809.1 hypothetical protein Caci_2900 [Catenulispora acidiphila DSM 44928]
MRRIPTITAVLTLAALGGCTSAKVNTTPVAPAEAATTAAHAAATSSTSAAPKKAGLGDTVKISGRNAKLAVTLVKIVDPAKGSDEFTVPDAGKHFVALQVRVVNQGSGVYSDDPQADVTVKNAAGETMSIAFATTTAGADMPSSVNLTAGDTALGFVDFQVPDGQKITQVQYALTSLGGDNVAQWTIG